MDQMLLVKGLFKAQFPWITIAQNQPQLAPQLALWNNINFRLFLTSECAGIFGNHFYQLALPLLVKEFTGSAGAMSVSIVLSGISRVAFMMVGGTLSDRFSPRHLLLASSVLRGVLLLAIIIIALAGQMNIVALYGFSFASGMTDAIFVPARGSVMPLLVEKELLKAANALTSAQEKLWGLVGPVMAGLFISWMSNTAAPASDKPLTFQGPVIAFLVAILGIIVSIIILRPVKFATHRIMPVDDTTRASNEHVQRFEEGSIRDVIRLIREKASLRVSFLMVYAINCLSGGPLYIGMPMLAVSRFPEGAQALGFLTSAIGGGALVGTLLAGVLPQPKPDRMGRLFLTVIGGLFAGLVVLASAVSISVGAIAVLVIAALISYVNITGLVQIQKDTPPAFMGRMMGLLNLK